MRHVKDILLIVLGLALGPALALAATQISVPSPSTAGQMLSSNANGSYTATTTDPLHAGSFYATSSTASQLPYASTTAISSSLLTSGNCVQASTGGLLTTTNAACNAGTVTSVTGTWPLISSGGATPNFTWGGISTSTIPAANRVAFWSSGSALSSNSTFIFDGTNLGIGTSTPGTLLSIGNTGVDTINLVPTATSTFGHGININGNDCFAVSGTCLQTIIQAATAFKQATKYTSTSTLPANVYNNGVGGVGATITGTALAPLFIDGNTAALGDRILVKNEGTGANNGIYTVTTAGVGGVAAFVLTRATDYNSQADVYPGVSNFTNSGTVNANTCWVLSNITAVTIGTTALTYDDACGAGSFSGTFPITVTGTTISFTGIGTSSALGTNQVVYSTGVNTVASVGTSTVGFSGPFSGLGFGALIGGSNTTITWTGLATTSSLVDGRLLYGSGVNGVANVATSTLTFSGPFSGLGFGTLVGGSNTTLTWTGLATTTALTANQVLYASNSTSGVAGNNNFVWLNGAGWHGVGTSTPQWLADLSTSTAPQLAFEDGKAGNIWTERGVGGSFYFATATAAATFATSTKSWLAIDANGIPTFNALGGLTGCAQFDANGKVSNTGTACGSGSVTSPFEIATSTGLAISGVAYISNTSGRTTLASVATSSETCSSPLSCTAHAVLTGGGAISIANAVSDGATKGAASFTAADFNDSSGNISIDYTNGTAATVAAKGFLTAADWGTFNNKVGTTSQETAGQLAAWGTTQGTPPKLYSVGTTTITFSGPFSGTGYGALVGGSNTTVTWTGLATSSVISAPQVVYATGVNTVASVATSSLTVDVPLSTSGTFGYFVNGSAPHIGCTTATISAAGCVSAASFLVFNNKVATSAQETANNLSYWTTTLGTPPQLGSATNLNWLNGANYLGAGTTTPAWLVDLSTTTRPQLAFEDGALGHIWTQRAVGGAFYYATATATTGFATSTKSWLTIDANGIPTFSSLASITCLGTDATGKFSSGTCSGSPNGSDGQLQYKSNTAFAGISTTTLTFSGPFSGLGFGTLVGGSNTTLTWTGLATTTLLTANQVLYAANSTTGVTGSNNFVWLNGGNWLGVGTTTPQWLVTLSTTTAPQLVLQGAKTDAPWSFRSIGGYLYVATTTNTATFATTTLAAFSITAGGEVTTEELDVATTTTSTTIDWVNTPNQVRVRVGTAAMNLQFMNATNSAMLGSRKLVYVCNPALTAGAMTWVGVEWIGSTPTQTTTANQCDVFSFDVTQGTSTSAVYKVAGSAGTGFN